MKIKKIVSANGEITVPGDKSISHRAVMFNSLAKGTARITGFLNGADCLSTIECFKALGIDINNTDGIITVHGKGLHALKEPSEMLYTGNSGTTTRLLCGILAGQNFNSSITGDKSIEKRPMNRVTEPLSLMGAKIQNNYCPLYITGSKLHGTEYRMTVASAQVKTALILAALYADGETIIYEKEKSRDHTERMLAAMGADIVTDNLKITVRPGKELKAVDINVCGDISSAAFFMVLGAVMPSSCITLRNVGINPTRTGIIDVMKEMGANITIHNQRTVSGEPVADITVTSSKLHGVTIGGDTIPRLIDEIPAIAAAAVFADGETVICDAHELRVKETDRIAAIEKEFLKCGIDITASDDGMTIRGGKHIHGADFKTYGDHRMAMSLAVLAQLAEGESTLDDAECVAVSYPDFFKHLYKLG